MKNRIPLIKSVMTPFPYSVDVSTAMSVAREYMLEHKIHHLPVVDGDKIAGILHENDFVTNRETAVGEYVFKKPVVFDLNERLDKILLLMADRRVDTVLITRHDKLAGIFTFTDACRQYAEYLREEFGPHDGNDAA